MYNTKKIPRIVCIGGGTGTFVILKGLKEYTCQLSAIVTMSDSGGSNKRIRDEFGLLPTSDIRQCFVALSEEKGGIGLLRKLFMYRFEKGKGLTGMTFGNLFMAALSDILGSQEEAIRQTGKVLRIHGTVIPVSYTNTNLFAVYENNTIVAEEHLIDEPCHDGKLKINNVFLKPEAEANSEALKVIRGADIIIIGPGDLYTSLIPNLLVHDIAREIIDSSAKKIFVMNLMTKYGQTYNFAATDHLHAIEQYLDKAIDIIILNDAPMNTDALKIYEKYHEKPVVNNLPKKSYFTQIQEDIISNDLHIKSKSDRLYRSLIRHDSDKLAQIIIKIWENRI